MNIQTTHFSGSIKICQRTGKLNLMYKTVYWWQKLKLLI